jgi:hypothetical protein
LTLPEKGTGLYEAVLDELGDQLVEIRLIPRSWWEIGERRRESTLSAERASDPTRYRMIVVMAVRERRSFPNLAS